ncbi:MAG: hypothetical protein ACKO03_03135 [Bacteroidota bacterium]
MHLALIFLLLDRAVQLVVYGRKKALLSLIIVVPFLWLFLCSPELLLRSSEALSCSH